jgi:hypothetical protein
MSQAPDYLARELANPPDAEPPEDSLQTLWHWFAIGLLVFCWIVEARISINR